MSALPMPSLLLCESCGDSRRRPELDIIRVPFPVVEGADRVILVCADAPECQNYAESEAIPELAENVPSNVIPMTEPWADLA